MHVDAVRLYRESGSGEHMNFRQFRSQRITAGAWPHRTQRLSDDELLCESFAAALAAGG